MAKIRVVMCPVDRAPYVTWIEDSLENLPKVVGGYIECVRLTEEFVIICNEEGRLMGLPENKSLPFPGLVGDCFICGFNGENLVGLEKVQGGGWLRRCKTRWSALS